MKRASVLRELQFIVGMPPPQLWRMLRLYRPDWTLQTLRRLSQAVFVGSLARLARNRAVPENPGRPAAPPVFIIGHWRSGTSVLQRLLATDSRFRTPTFIDCAFPQAAGGLKPWFLRRLAGKLPPTRGFDAFPLDVNAEFEDEFALFKLTLESPMLAYVFPEQARAIWNAFYAAPASSRWLAACEAFIRRHATDDRYPLLKSPTHAFRVPALAASFPGARFINIVRDPVDVHLSSLALEENLLRNNALQAVPRADEELVLQRQAAHAEAIESARRLLPANRFAELTFRALHAQPETVLQRLCAELELSAFNPAREPFEQAVAQFHRHRRRWVQPAAVRERVHAVMNGSTDTNAHANRRRTS